MHLVSHLSVFLVQAAFVAELLITSLFHGMGEHCLVRVFVIMVIILFVYFHLSHLLTPSDVCARSFCR